MGDSMTDEEMAAAEEAESSQSSDSMTDEEMAAHEDSHQASTATPNIELQNAMPTEEEAILRGAGQTLGDYPMKGFAAVKSYLENKKYNDVLTEQRKREGASQERFPMEYYGSQVAAGVTGEGLLGKALPFLKEIPMATSLIAGEIYGSSKADRPEDLPGKLLEGGAGGLGGYAIGKGLQKAGGAFFSGMMGISPKVTEAVNKNPNLLNSEDTLTDIGKGLQSGIIDLKDKVTKLSHEAIDKLPKDLKINAQPFIDKFKALIAKSSSSSEPKNKAVATYLTDFMDNFTANTKSTSSGNVISPQKLKTEVQDLGGVIDWDLKSGEFNSPENRAKKDLLFFLNDHLKTNYPEYKSAMVPVAKETEALKNVSNHFGISAETGQPLDSLERKLAKIVTFPDKNKGAAEVLKALDSSLGTDYYNRNIAATINSVLAGEGRTQGSARTYMMSLLGGALSNIFDTDPWQTAAVLGGVGRILDTKGPQIGRGLLKANKYIPDLNPGTMGNLGTAAINQAGPPMGINFNKINQYFQGQQQNQPQTMQAKPIGNDMQSAANHFVQMKRDPNYRKKILDEGNQSELQQ